MRTKINALEYPLIYIQLIADLAGKTYVDIKIM